MSVLAVSNPIRQVIFYLPTRLDWRRTKETNAMAKSTKPQYAAKKAARTRKRRAAGKKAAMTRKRKAAARKAAATRRRKAAARKAAKTRRENAAIEIEMESPLP
jgi:hypothetical protein